LFFLGFLADVFAKNWISLCLAAASYQKGDDYESPRMHFKESAVLDRKGAVSGYFIYR
jgi:hypothetical protein